MRRAIAALVLLLGCGGEPMPIDAAAGMDAPSAIDAPASDARGADAPADLDGAGGLAIGEACTDDAECSGPNAQCLDSFPGAYWSTWPSGYCSRTGCTFGATCGPGAACSAHPGIGPRCFRTCTTSADCRTTDGYTCQLHPILMDEMFCLPAIDGG
jgi:hypothetical protein